MKHIAIFRQPFFNLIMSGEKTVESRWSMKKIAPYGAVKIGDEIFFETNRSIFFVISAQDAYV